MIRTSGRLILSLLAGLFMAVSVAAPAQAEITEGDRSALNDMIRDYILANPEIVREALINLAEREEREREEQEPHGDLRCFHRGSFHLVRVRVKVTAGGLGVEVLLDESKVFSVSIPCVSRYISILRVQPSSFCSKMSLR